VTARQSDKQMADDQAVFTRVINAPRALVFKAMTDPECLKRWWGPKGFECVVAKFELRSGGEFIFNLKAPAGPEMCAKWVYLEIASPQRLEFLSSFCDPSGKVTTAPFPMDFPLEVLNIWTLAETAGKTTLTLRATARNATRAQIKTFADLNASMQQGYGGTLDQLEAFLAAG
jgi:uncharacterized protein YndB with AHSA1/START domain